jgi:preprotein translocase subunit SecF
MIDKIKKPYLLFSVVAIILIIFSIYNLQKLRLGIDFKGGSYLTAEINKSIDINQLEKAFNEKGLESKASLYKVEKNYKLEVEIAFDEEMAYYDNIRNEIEKSLQQYSKTGKEEFLKEVYEKVKNVKSKDFSNLSPAQIQEEIEKLFIQSKENYEKKIAEVMKYYASDYSIYTTTPLLGFTFFDKVKVAVLIAAIAILIVIFLNFKNPYASLAILIAGFSDIIVSLGFMSYFNIPLSLTTVIALLMLVGYALDTNILLTTKLIKFAEKEREKVLIETMKTGLTMTTTGLMAFLILLFVGYYFRIQTYLYIGFAVLAGLIADVFTTWGINATLLLKAKKEKTEEKG